MIVNIRDLTAKGNTIELQEELDLKALLDERSEVASSGPLHADLKAWAAGDLVYVDGNLTIELELICSRCLAGYRDTLHIPFREMFSLTTQKPEKPQSEDYQDDEDDEEINKVAEDRVDLKPYIEQSVLLNLPFVPLCGEECQGLCPVCGGNRNETACGCKQENIDPRLAGLADFFNKPQADR